MTMSESLDKAIGLFQDLDDLQFRLHSGVQLVSQCHTAMENSSFVVGQNDYDALFAAYLFLYDLVDNEFRDCIDKMGKCLFDAKHGVEQMCGAS